VGVHDFNGDGQTDLLWQHADGRLAVWFMNGTTLTNATYLNPSQVDPSWQIVATADINGDGQTEILWENANGTLAYWLMNGSTGVGAGLLNPSQVDPSWRIVGPK
jgi:hypothetical protein